MNLYVKSISKSIKGEKVLDDISYTFESGKIYGMPCDYILCILCLYL